jgi:hypothetical protein
MPCPGDAANKNNVGIIIFIYSRYCSVLLRSFIYIIASSP